MSSHEMQPEWEFDFEHNTLMDSHDDQEWSLAGYQFQAPSTAGFESHAPLSTNFDFFSPAFADGVYQGHLFAGPESQNDPFALQEPLYAPMPTTNTVGPILQNTSISAADQIPTPPVSTTSSELTGPINPRGRYKNGGTNQVSAVYGCSLCPHFESTRPAHHPSATSVQSHVEATHPERAENWRELKVFLRHEPRKNEKTERKCGPRKGKKDKVVKPKPAKKKVTKKKAPKKSKVMEQVVDEVMFGETAKEEDEEEEEAVDDIGRMANIASVQARAEEDPQFNPRMFEGYTGTFLG